MSDPLLLLFEIVVLIYSIVLHELAHGYSARAMGDHTAEDMGRLTLNPIRHMDMVGSFILPLLTLLLGGFMFGYAKPVPYNPRNLNDHRWGPAKVAIAGPLMNLLLAAIFGAAIRLFGASLDPVVVDLFSFVVMINVGLAIFNLLPIPPLDGHWILGTVAPGLMRGLYRFQWLLLVLVIFVIFPMLYPIVGFLFRLLTGMPLI